MMKNEQCGWTYMELLVAIVIVGVLSAFAVQGFAQARASVGMGVARAAVMDSLLAAQRQSTAHHRNVVLCASVDGVGCDGSTHWEGGWIAFVDRNADRRRQPEEALVQQVPATAGLHIRSSRGRVRIVMQPQGGVAAGSNATLVLCDERGAAAASAVIVSNSGNVRQGRASASRAATDCP